MKCVVVDTNVPIVANGKSEQASPQCVMSCACCLNELKQRGKLVLDREGLILREYMNNLERAGQPGPGDAFLKWVLDNQWNPHRCEMVTITAKEDSDQIDFVEFPRDPALAGFDKDDKKFVAVAAAHPDKPPILQAVDTRWWQMRATLGQAGVRVDFLCEADMRRLLSE
jgi:hypothetical protein